ncbi:MAG TPA: isoprenylcysteine carboxylmethyltransferase family protein [Chthoniobacteraceae bacterium]|nr:isoprenylcysteine carboxylmethyltransferase family protein [Chthoniobacteraceae bacterium]
MAVAKTIGAARGSDGFPGGRVPAILAGAAVYFGLAVVGWGGLSPFFSHAPLIGLAVATLAITVVSLFAGGNLNAGVREDRANRWVLKVFTLVGLVDAWLPAFTDRHDFWTFGGDCVRWAGVAVYLIGAGLRLWPVFVLGDRFSGLVAIQPGHKLVTGGIYRIVRHPSYLGALVVTLGWGLAFRSGAGVILAACLLPPLIARIFSEEKMLRSEFGAEYDAFRACTRWRLVPGVW